MTEFAVVPEAVILSSVYHHILKYSCIFGDDFAGKLWPSVVDDSAERLG